MIKKGDKLVCLCSAGYVFLTEGQVYTAMGDQEEGIFADRPFVTVTGDDSQPATCHTSRFVPHDGEEVTPAKMEQLREELRQRLSIGAG